LKEQLALVKSACEEYDADAVYAILDELQTKSWKSTTLAHLDEIRDCVYLESDFDKAAEAVENFVVSGG
jgi:hypothetical protein